MSGKRWSVIALGAFATGILVAPTMVGATTTAKSGATQSAAGGAVHAVSHAIPKAEQRATLRYWTPERMRNAKSLDVIARGAAPTIGKAAPSANGAPGSVAPKLPNGHIVNKGLRAGAGGDVIAQGYSYPFPFDRHAVFPVSLYKKTPWQVNGKVFFTQNGSNFVCSGTSVSATNADEVWLAGHCVSNGAGTFDSFAEFVPAYNGNASHCCSKGIFVANNLVTTSAWHNSGDFSLDEGAMTVNPNAGGVKLQNKVGAAGFAWNQARDQQFVDFGYPQAAPFNGTQMISCLAATAVYDTGIGGAGPAPNGIGCDMTGGSSGGSWQIQWGGANGNAPGYINGHNDYKYGSQPLAMYSPYFDTTANVIRCFLEVAGQNGC